MKETSYTTPNIGIITEEQVFYLGATAYNGYCNLLTLLIAGPDSVKDLDELERKQREAERKKERNRKWRANARAAKDAAKTHNS